MIGKTSFLELESYRLAQYSSQVPCYVCTGGNAFDTELCRHCLAPMALAHQARDQAAPPNMIATIGASGAGKTVYLGMLADTLSRGQGDMHLLARGAFSVTLQQTTMAALSRCEFPQKTPGEPDRWNWVHCQVSSPERRPLELIMPDMAGEAVLEEMDHPNTFPVIRSFLEKCSGVLVLIDAERVQEGEQDQDYFTMKMLSYLVELMSNPQSGWPARPVGLVFTKADLTESCFDDPVAFARRHMPGLSQHCRERFRKHQFFAAGVAGAVGYRRLSNGARQCFPLRVEPRGIVEPFQWLLGEI